AEKGCTIADLMWANEKVWRSEAEIKERLDKIWDVMQKCVQRGCQNEGVLPGRLKVKRRAPDIYRSLTSGASEMQAADPLTILDWVNLYALAVNEENACGSRIVTAPTNGAAGIMPAVMTYYERFCRNSTRDGLHV